MFNMASFYAAGIVKFLSNRGPSTFDDVREGPLFGLAEERAEDVLNALSRSGVLAASLVQTGPREVAVLYALTQTEAPK